MPKIDQFSDPVTPAAPETPAVDLLSRFESDPDLQLIPVVDGDRVVGMIERSALLMRLTVSPAAPFTTQQLMDVEPVVVDGDVEAHPLSEILLKGGPAAVMRGFIVTHAGRYHSVGTPACLLRAICGSAPEASARTTTNPAPASNDRLIAMLESEMTAPINSIRAITEQLVRRSSSPELLDDIRMIQAQADSLRTTLNDTSELADAVPPRQTSPTALRAVNDEVEAAWTPRAALNGVTLMVGFEGDTELLADLDGSRLRRLFDSLIGNALEMAREGMVEAHLKIQSIGDEVQLKGRVRDDAPRIETADLIRALAPETELGDNFALAVSRRLTTRLGGRLWSENNAGRGVTVNFEFHAPRSQDLTETVSNVQSLVDLDTRDAPHILIVDDNATNRVVAQALCEMFGCSCETAEDGLEALEAVQARPFDLILMDIKMPRMDGLQATRAIRAMDAPQSNLPIIALTANADPADAAIYIASGMISVVEKPIKPERLRMAMNAALVGSDTSNHADQPDRRQA